MTRVPHVGARANFCCGCMRTSVVELIGMHETIALGRCSIFDRTFALVPRAALGKPSRMDVQTLARKTWRQSFTIRLKSEAR